MKILKKSFAVIFAVMLIVCVLSIPAFASEVVIDFYPEYVAPTVEDAVEAEKSLIEVINGKVNSFAWGPIMLVLLVGTGIYFTIRTKFFQFTKFGHILKNTVGKLFKRDKSNATEKGAITPFQALTTAMAGTVGTGNIAGVTGAIILGGPGAVFWMWVSALFGMMTKFSEVVLSVKYREKNDKGEWVGGPMYYIKNGLGKRFAWIGGIFAVLGALCAFGIGNMTQVNTIAGSFSSAVNALVSGGISNTTSTVIKAVIGVILAVLTGFVLLGGVSRIGKVTEKLIPFMSVFYIVGSLVVVFANIDKIGGVFATIFQSAFAPNAVIGGVGGFVIMNTIKRGVSRGVFSNEAGLGSAPIAHASTSEITPVKQGLYGVFEVFVDTIIICTLTSLVVLMSGVVVPWGDSNVAGQDLATMAFATVFGTKLSSIFIAIAILFFAFSTVLSWSYYGSTCFSYLTKGKAVKVYQIIFVAFIVIGAVMKLSLVWDIADTLNGLMAIPNLIALLALSGVVIKLVKEYAADIKK